MVKNQNGILTLLAGSELFNFRSRLTNLRGHASSIVFDSDSLILESIRLLKFDN